MKFLSIISVAVFSIVSAFAQAPAPVPAPKIVCDKPDFDFGLAEPGSVVNHDYEIRNAGDLTLEIKNVRASCGCTVAKTSSTVLKPGDTAQITASLNLAGRSGPQSKHVIVESNDPASPTLILNLRGGVRQDFDLAPPQLSPGQIRGDTAVEMDVIFQNNTAAPVNVTKATALTNVLIATVSSITNGRTYRIHVKTVPPLSVGNISSTIRLETDSPTHPVFDVPFNAAVMGALTVAPQTIMFGGVATNPATRYIIIRSGTSQNFKVLSVEAPTPGITVDISPFGNSGTRIALNNIIPTADLNGKTFKITTDVESMKEILVPISIVIAQ